MAFPFDDKVDGKVYTDENGSKYIKIVSQSEFTSLLFSDYGTAYKVVNGDLNRAVDVKYYKDLAEHKFPDPIIEPEKMELLYQHYYKNARKNKVAYSKNYKYNVGVLLNRYSRYVNDTNHESTEYFDPAKLKRDKNGFELLAIAKGTKVYKSSYGFDKSLNTKMSNDDEFIFKEAIWGDLEFGQHDTDIIKNPVTSYDKTPPEFIKRIISLDTETRPVPNIGAVSPELTISNMAWVGDTSTAACYLKRFYGGFLEYEVNADLALFMNTAENFRQLKRFLTTRLYYMSLQMSDKEKIQKYFELMLPGADFNNYYNHDILNVKNANHYYAELKEFEHDIRTYSIEYLQKIIKCVDELYYVEEDSSVYQETKKALKRNKHKSQILLYNKIITYGRPVYGYMKKPAVALDYILTNERIVNEFLTRRFKIKGVFFPRTITITLDHFYHECLAILPEYLTPNLQSEHSWPNWEYDLEKLTKYKFELNTNKYNALNTKFKYTEKYFNGMAAPPFTIDKTANDITIFSLNVHSFGNLNAFDSDEKTTSDLINLIKSAGADIVAFQEAEPNKAHIITSACGYKYFYFIANGDTIGHCGVFVATMHRPSNVHSAVRMYPSGGGRHNKHRGYLTFCYLGHNMAFCHIEVGEAIVKFARPNLKERFKYAAELKHNTQSNAVSDIIETCRPDIIVGDFNFMPIEPPYDILQSQGFTATNLTLTTNVHYSVTDYIFYKNVNVRHSAVIQYPHSDHNAIVCTFEKNQQLKCINMPTETAKEIDTDISRLHTYHNTAVPWARKWPTKYLGAGESYQIGLIIAIIIFILIIYYYYVFNTSNTANNMHFYSGNVHSPQPVI